jgi:hypothetical protein
MVNINKTNKIKIMPLLNVDVEKINPDDKGVLIIPREGKSSITREILINGFHDKANEALRKIINIINDQMGDL